MKIRITINNIQVTSNNCQLDIIFFISFLQYCNISPNRVLAY